MEVVLFLLAAFFAEVVGTVAGFGSSTIFLPLALFFVEFRVALVLVALFHVFGNLGRIFFFKSVDWRLFLWFGLVSVVFSFVGARLVLFFSQDLLKLVLGLFLLVFVVLSWRKFRLPKSKFSLVSGGCVSGFFSGLIGTGGAFRGAVLNSFDLSKSAYIATGAVIALVVDLTRIPVYLSEGFLPDSFYWLVPLLFFIAVFGAFVGKRIVDVIPQSLFRKVVLVAIALVALGFVLEYFIKL